MAKYYGSPWGEIRGKLGPCVGVKRKGINYIRINPVQINPNTPKQQNQRKAVFAILTHIVKENLQTLIHPIWDKLKNKNKPYLDGLHFFVSANSRKLYKSIPDENKPFYENNFPDYSKMLVSMGKLEPAYSISVNLCSNQRKSASINQRKSASIKWNPNTYQNGTPDDEVHCAIFQRPTKKLPYGKLTILSPGSRRLQPANPKRSDAEVTINHRLLTINCFIYIFFYNKNIGYSPSKGIQIPVIARDKVPKQSGTKCHSEQIPKS